MQKNFVNAFYETRFLEDIDNLNCEQILLNEQNEIDTLSQEEAYTKIASDIKKMQHQNIAKAVMHSAFLKALIKAVCDTGFKATICLGLSAKDAIFTYEQLENFYLKVKDLSPNITYCLYLKDVFCEEYEMEQLLSLSQKYNLDVIIETCKTLDEVGKCAKLNNDMSPIEILNENGLLNENTTLVHCNYLELEDEFLIAQSGAKVVATPIFSAACGLGLTNIVSLLKSGIEVFVGTGASQEYDLKKQAEFLCLMQKFNLKEADCVNLKMQEKIIQKLAEYDDGVLCKCKKTINNTPNLLHFFQIWLK